MAEIATIILISFNVAIRLVALYFTLRPKNIKIVDKSTDKEVHKTAVMTPSGVFVVPKKRAPVYNTDEDLWTREQES